MHSIKRHTTTILIVAIILVVAGAMAYLLLRPQPASSPSANDQAVSDTTKESDKSTPVPTSEMPIAGTYVSYSADAVAAAKGTKLLFFHAPWCPQCRELEASINASHIPTNVTIFKVDYDSNQALRQKYGVTLQTTLVSIDDAGNKIKGFVAYDDPTFPAVKEAFGL